MKEEQTPTGCEQSETFREHSLSSGIIYLVYPETGSGVNSRDEEI